MIFKLSLKKLAFICFLGVFLTAGKPAFANNKVGIHILETAEVKKAAQLVNSSGGDWGYITIVLREDDFKKEKWQDFFDNCRRLHLIPIVRIATHMIEGGTWAKPNFSDLEKYSKFLNSLNWPVKQQIVVIFNEPNHKKEWGGEVNPSEYTQVLDRLISLFKKENKNFFILPAGLDQAADGKNGTIDEAVFLTEMARAVPDIFNKIDGWSSHSYPNHGFVGLPDDQGKATIKGFKWELAQLKKLGLDKNLPIYITETGWPHQQGKITRSQFFDENKTAQFIEKAFIYWQKDNQVKAVTPFVLNYSDLPFDHFSWLKNDGSHYQQFDKVLGISKIKASPEQIEDYQIVDLCLPDLLPTNYSYHGKIKIKNTGQWIMGEKDDFILPVKNKKTNFQGYRFIQLPKLSKGKLIEPGREAELEFVIRTGNQSTTSKFVLGGETHELYIFKPFELRNKKVSLWQQIKTRFSLWWQEKKEE